MKKKILKIVLWLAGIVILVVIFLIFLGLYGYRIQNYFMIQRQERMLANLEIQKAEILEIQKNDTYGGKTPEETLDLYIEALKAGDIELASKYYEISIENAGLQKKELDNLSRISNEKNNLDLVIEEVENIRYFGIKETLINGNISFVYNYITKEEIKITEVVSREEIITIIPVGTELKVGNAFRLNPYTRVWKIIQ